MGSLSCGRGTDLMRETWIASGSSAWPALLIHPGRKLIPSKHSECTNPFKNFGKFQSTQRRTAFRSFDRGQTATSALNK